MNTVFFRHMIVLSLSFQLPFAAWSSATRSEDKTVAIKKIIEKHVLDTGVDLEKIHQEVSRIVPLDPVKTPEYRALIEKRDMTVKKKFPLSDQQLRKMFQPQAERLYPLYKIGDQVSITYLLHGKPFTVRGKFYRKNGNVFYIGSAKIAKYTIPDEMVSKLDAVKNNSSKNKYIAERISTYHKNRQAYADQLFKDEIMQVQGYLKIAQKWVSARDYIQMELKQTVENNDMIQIKFGDRFAKQKKYTESAKCYRRAAELGNSDGQYKLGLLYYHGNGVEKNSKQAIFWLHKAAEQGNKDGQYYLGMCYANGWGVDADYSEACNWLKKSADQGHTEAYKLFLQYRRKLETKDSPDQSFAGKNNGNPAKIINNGPKQKITNEMNFEELCVILQHFSNYCNCKNVKRDLPAFFDKDGRTIWYTVTETKIIYNKNLPTYKEKKVKLLNMYNQVIIYIDKFYSLPIKQLEEKHLSDKIYYIGDSGYGKSGFCCDWHGTALAQRGSAKAQFAMGLAYLAVDFVMSLLVISIGKLSKKMFCG